MFYQQATGCTIAENIEIWRASAVILGFQLTLFGWRMTRERKMAEDNRLTWMPISEVLNLAAMLINITGTFLAPIIGVTKVHPQGALGLSLILLGCYPFALAGHYKFYGRPWRIDPDYFPKQEKIAVVLAILVFSVALVVFGHWVAASVVLAACLVITLAAWKWK
jgi:hypothetical protein